MIINTGQRTDIPAFYAKWFANRLKEGYVLVRNPYNPQQVTRYLLDPSVVDVIGFCSKNPAPMLEYMNLLSPYGQFWYVTVTPYGKEIEPAVPNKLQVLETFKKLSDIVGPNRIGWRYDPVFISDAYPIKRHLKAFEYMAKELSPYTKITVISFVDMYEKTRRNFPEVREVTSEDRLLLGKSFIQIANTYGMTVFPCAEGNELEQFGADCRGCMTVSMYEEALGQHLKVPYKTPARKECACYLSGDIGAYNTCGHFCKYCYANFDENTVRINMKLHDPQSPLLIGHLNPDDQIHEAKQESWIEKQIQMDLSSVF